MKMLGLAPNIQQGCIRGVSDFDDETGAIGDAVILISDVQDDVAK